MNNRAWPTKNFKFPERMLTLEQGVQSLCLLSLKVETSQLLLYNVETGEENPVEQTLATCHQPGFGVGLVHNFFSRCALTV